MVIVLLALACASCSAAAAEPTAQAPAASTVTSQPLATSTAAPTAEPTDTPTAIPTSTATPPPTPTATLALPVSLGTPLPELAPITAENVDRLELVGDYRRLPAAGLRTVLSDDGSIFFTVVPDGIDIYRSKGPAFINHLNISVLRPAPERPLWQLLQASADGSRLLVIRPRGADVFSAQGETLFSHDSPEGLEWENLSYALSPDGRFVAVEMCSVGCYRRNPPFTQDFFIFEVDSGQPVYHWNQGVGGELRGAGPVFSPDSKYLITYIGGQAFLWDTATWKKITSYTAKVEWYVFPRFAYFAPDSGRVAIVSESTVSVWDTVERRVLGQWSDRMISPMTEIIFSADGSTVGLYNQGWMQVREVAGGNVLREEEMVEAGIAALRLASDGAWQVSAPPEDPSPLPAPWSADFTTWGLSFDPFAQVPALRIPGIGTQGTCRWQPDGSADCMEAAAIAGTDGKLYHLEYGDAALAIMQDADASELMASLPPRQYDSINNILAFDPVGKFLFYNARTGGNPHGTMANLSHGSLEVIAQYPMPFEASAISPDGRYIALQAREFPKNQLLIFDLQARQMIYDRNFLYGAPGLAFSADSSTLMHLIDQPGRENIQRITLMRMDDRNRPINVPLEATYRELPEIFQFTPDGDLLYSVSNGDLRWIHLPDGEVAASLDPFPNDNLAHPFAISPDGRLLAVFYQGELKVWGVRP